MFLRSIIIKFIALFIGSTAISNDLLFPFPPVIASYYKSSQKEDSLEFLDSQKVIRLQKIIINKAHVRIRTKKIAKIVEFINAKRSKGLNFGDKKSIYYHRSKNVSLDIHFFSDGHTYINFTSRDPVQGKGGYKYFSRALDFDSEELKAHLRAKLPNESRLKKITRELNFMKLFRARKSLVSVDNYDVATIKVGDKLMNEYQLYMPLYEGDIKYFTDSWSSCQEILTIFEGMAASLIDLHEMEIVHNDIKPANFFYNVNGPDLSIALGDFGLSVHLQDDRFGRFICGTRGYMDPAMCFLWSKKKRSFISFDDASAADIYSLGISFQEILVGRKFKLRDKTRELNLEAMPKGRASLSRQKVTYAYKRLVEAHESFFTDNPKVHKRKIVLDLSKNLIWQMTNPSSSKRPNAINVFQSIKELRKNPICL